MPSFDQHEIQASNNIGLVRDLMNLTTGGENPCLKYPDWVATVCFYSVVHVIEAEIFMMDVVYYSYNGKKLALKDIFHSSDFKRVFPSSTMPTSPHFYRQLVVEDSRNGFTPEVQDAYKNLYEYSCQSRYKCSNDCSKNVKKSRKALNIIVDYHKLNFKSNL